MPIIEDCIHRCPALPDFPEFKTFHMKCELAPPKLKSPSRFTSSNKEFSNSHYNCVVV